MQSKHKRLFTSFINRNGTLRRDYSLEQTLVQMLKNSNRNVISGAWRWVQIDYYVSEDADSKEKRENTRFTLLKC
jgi:hypothetical protein